MASHILGMNRPPRNQSSFLLLVWSRHKEVRSTACEGFAWVKQPGGMGWEAVRILILGSEAKEDDTLRALTWQDMLWKQREKGKPGRGLRYGVH